MYHSDSINRELTDMLNLLAQAMYRFVMNVRDGARCHRVLQGELSLPKQKRRSVCGWRFGSATSFTITKASNVGRLCRRCFPKGVVVVQDGNGSPIEQYDD